MPLPTTTNINHYRGDSLRLKLQVWADYRHSVPSDLSAAVVRGQVRSDPDATDVVCNFDIAVDGNTITADLSPKSARDLVPKGWYDVEIDFFGDDTLVQTIATGQILTTADITRDGTVV